MRGRVLLVLVPVSGWQGITPAHSPNHKEKEYWSFYMCGGDQEEEEGHYGYEGHEEKAPHFFPLPCGFFDSPFPFPLCLVSAVKAPIPSVFWLGCGDAGVAFVFFGGGVVLVGLFCGVLLCAFVFCAWGVVRGCADMGRPLSLVCLSTFASVSIVSSCGWRSVGVMSSLVWPSSFMMDLSQFATLMGSGSASNYFSLLISRMTRSVIMPAPSCFPAFMRLRNAASLPVSCGIFCESIWSMRSVNCVSVLLSPSVRCMYSRVLLLCIARC